MIMLLLCTNAQSFSQKKATYRQAIYVVSFPVNDATAGKAILQSLLLSNIKYVIKANDSLYSVETSDAIAKDDEHLHTTITGPQKIYFDINRNLIAFDTRDNELQRFNPVHFDNTGKDTVVNNYLCKLLLSSNQDSLFVTEKLPWYLNPFLLNKESAHTGVVKAIMKSGSVFDLLSVEQEEGNPFPKTVFPVTSKIIIQKNIFF